MAQSMDAKGLRINWLAELDVALKVVNNTKSSVKIKTVFDPAIMPGMHW